MHVTHLDDRGLAPALGSYSAPSRLRMMVPPQRRRYVPHHHSLCPRFRHSPTRSGETRSGSGSSSGGRVLFGPEPPPHGGALRALCSTFESYSASKRLRMMEPPFGRHNDLPCD